jgi:putative aldouronate transport system permease protein
MYGIIIAFKNFNFAKGILASPWNNFQNFKDLFGSRDFYQIFWNSLSLSVLRLVITFPVPIILAILLNEIGSTVFKRTAQTLLYLPHFISWVVISGITINFLSMQDGLVNIVLERMGLEKINFLASTDWFRTLIISTSIWKEAGWGTIIYLAALTGINPEYYEAALVDGANRFQRIFYITLPSIKSTIVILLILSIGGIMGNGFEQIFLFQNDLNIKVSEVFETYTYRVGILGGRFSFSAAVGLFQSVIGFILVMSANRIARMLGQASYY